jgi:hypothetical protein
MVKESKLYDVLGEYEKRREEESEWTERLR